MLRPSGIFSDVLNERQRMAMAAQEAISQVVSSLPHQRAAQSQGIGAVVQSDGEYDEDGDWQHYLRCGDPLDSAGCAP